ncbi:MAG: 16S rRNA (adenine(1518)-N(6)/adenine(1519)-N(6))-dimethyltransferase RsmA [Elusimicrobiaceae bacterium]|nr:16S rRNA (adenine(1518)-N(6)/adenine(1519)-N(6))-dimethyltransferase RsmA [Elusimicrobiaceae bacterium]
MPKYSQNFLTSHAAAASITQAANRHDGCEHAVEIGPGKGFLTRGLLAGRENKLTLVEIDPAMIAHLNGKYPVPQPFKLVNRDFLELDLDAEFGQYRRVLFVSNLPYATGTAIMQKLLGWRGFGAAVLMFQKEVADRILARPGSRQYGVLTLSVQSRALARRVTAVGRKLFSPPPKVDSAVVELTRLDTALLNNEAETAAFFHTVKAAFAHKRKTILNSLAHTPGLEKAALEDALVSCSIDPGARPETVPLEKFLALARLIR